MGDDNASTITALCTGAGAQFLAAGETFVWPTTAGMDFQYLAATFADGILAGFTSVSVHPYRSSIPETALPDWARLRGMIDAAAPPGRPPYGMLGGEWGYTSAGPACDYGNRAPAPLQGKYVPR